MLANAETVFLLDVDNTLLDNDRFGADLTARLDQSFGTLEQQRYWTIFAEARLQLGYADYLAALQKFRVGLDDDPQLLLMSQFMLEYPFAERLYPRALDVIAHLRTQGLAVILSDGDVVFQPRKIQRSGLWDAVGERVLVCAHKEFAQAAICRRYPAPHYVMVDDKPQLLIAMKHELGDRLTTVFVQQGHYANESAIDAADASIDMSVACIGDLLDFDLGQFLAAGTTRAAAVKEQHT